MGRFLDGYKDAWHFLTIDLGGKDMDIRTGEIVRLKKQHPCGSKEWEVLRVGADFRLKCMGCGHQIMIARKALEKSVREIKQKP